MPIVTCSCGAKLDVPAEKMGKTAKCPKCGELIDLTSDSSEMIVLNVKPPEETAASLYAKAISTHKARQGNVKDFRGASFELSKLYQEIIDKFPDSKEAKYARQQIDNIRGQDQSPPAKQLYAPVASSNVSPYAIPIFIVGVISIGAGILTFGHQELETFSKISLGLSAVISGILMFGFGSVVNNIAKIEQHLRKR